MRGSARLRGKSWILTIDVGRDPVTGKRRQKTKTLGPVNGKPMGKRAVDEELRRFIDEDATPTDRSQATLAELHAAYRDIRRSNSPGTVEEAERRFRSYVPDHMKKTPVGRITPFALDQLYLRLLSTLSASTIDRLHTDLNAMLNQAVKWGWVRDNPAKRATRPTVEHSEVELPSVSEVKELLQVLTHLDRGVTMLPDFVDLLIATGARPSELCATKVGDVQDGRLVISRSFSRGGGGVVKSTKTGQVRRLLLDEYTLAMLSHRRTRLAAVALAGGFPVEEMWWFPSRDNPARPVWGSTISKEFRAARGQSSTLTLRNLRHFVASHLVASGVDPRTAAGRLGHGTDMLLKTYSHVVPAADDAAAQVVPMVLDR